MELHRFVAQYRLVSWMEMNRHSQVTAARALGVDQGSLSKWIAGRKRPSFERMLEIAVRSGGFIQVADWAAPLPFALECETTRTRKPRR